MYIDVDGFVSAPSWLHSLQPPADDRILQSLLPKTPSSLTIGQVSTRCNESGPSKQKRHPRKGVTQGYTTETLDLEVAVVNHYNHQTWSEFKAKFRRRVSAYVVDWAA